MAFDSSERADLEGRAETRGVPVNPDDVADCTGPVDRGDHPVDLAEGGATDAVPDRFISAARGRLIGRWGTVNLNLLFVGKVAEAADGTPEEGRRVPEAS